MSTYPATALLPQSGSVVARWLLDEASGNRADSVGSSTLTDNNTVTAGTGYTNAGATFDNAADFEETNSETLSIADNATLSITGDLSISLLVKVESDPGAGEDMPLITKWNTTGNQRSYNFRYADVAGTKKLQFFNSTNGTLETGASVNKTLTTGTWFHIVMVYDASAGEVDFYADGVAVGTTQGSMGTSIFDSTATFIVGGINGGTLFYDGLMQDAIIWGGAELTSAEVLSLYTLYTTSRGILGSPIFFT